MFKDRRQKYRHRFPVVLFMSEAAAEDSFPRIFC